MSLDTSAIVRFTRFLISHKLTDLKVKEDGTVVKTVASTTGGAPTEQAITGVNLADGDGFSAAEMTKCGIAAPSLVDCVVDDGWTNPAANRKTSGVAGITAEDLEKAETGMQAWADAHGLTLSKDALWAIYYTNADAVHEEKVSVIQQQRQEAKDKIIAERGGKNLPTFLAEKLKDDSPLRGFNIITDDQLLTLLYLSGLSIPTESRSLIAAALKTAGFGDVDAAKLGKLLERQYKPETGKLYDAYSVIAYLKAEYKPAAPEPAPAPAPPKVGPPEPPAPPVAKPTEKQLTIKRKGEKAPYPETSGQVLDTLLAGGKTLIITRKNGTGYKIIERNNQLFVTTLDNKIEGTPDTLNDILRDLLGAYSSKNLNFQAFITLGKTPKGAKTPVMKVTLHDKTTIELQETAPAPAAPAPAVVSAKTFPALILEADRLIASSSAKPEELVRFLGELIGSSFKEVPLIEEKIVAVKAKIDELLPKALTEDSSAVVAAINMIQEADRTARMTAFIKIFAAKDGAPELKMAGKFDIAPLILHKNVALPGVRPEGYNKSVAAMRQLFKQNPQLVLAIGDYRISWKNGKFVVETKIAENKIMPIAALSSDDGVKKVLVDQVGSDKKAASGLYPVYASLRALAGETLPQRPIDIKIMAAERAKDKAAVIIAYAEPWSSAPVAAAASAAVVPAPIAPARVEAAKQPDGAAAGPAPRSPDV